MAKSIPAISVGDRIRITLTPDDGVTTSNEFTVVRIEGTRVYYAPGKFSYQNLDVPGIASVEVLERPVPAAGDRVRKEDKSGTFSQTTEFVVARVDSTGGLVPAGKQGLAFNPDGFVVIQKGAAA